VRCLVKGLLVMSLWLAACGRQAPVPAPEIETIADLVDALQGAGATVLQTAMMGHPAFNAPAKVLQINQGIVQVYEYESVAARQTVSQSITPRGDVISGTPVIWPDRPNMWAIGRLIVVYPGTDGGVILLLSGLLGDPLVKPETGLKEPFPPSVTAAIQFLSDSLAMDPGAIDVLSYDPVDWHDTCLSLPKPGEDCAEAITPGWRILLSVAGQEYEVHTDSIGEHIRRK
jgi:hypothetical protein